jgi:uncharacterized membrane protein
MSEVMSHGVDRFELGIEEGIMETVIALNLLGLNTSQSCEGHVDEEGIPAPWVEIKAPGEPQWQFVDEEKIFRETASKYGVTFEEAHRSQCREAWVEASRKCTEVTREHRQWQKECEVLQKRAELLLEEFHCDREVPSEIRLVIQRIGGGRFRIHNAGEDLHVDAVDLPEEERKVLRERLHRRRQEMNAFTDFLRAKFFSSP